MNQVIEKFQLKNWELVSVNPNNRNWVWSDYFNYWAISIQSVIGFSLIASFWKSSNGKEKILAGSNPSLTTSEEVVIFATELIN